MIHWIYIENIYNFFQENYILEESQFLSPTF